MVPGQGVPVGGWYPGSLFVLALRDPCVVEEKLGF